MKGIKTFVALQRKSESVDAIEKADQELYNRIIAFDFENQNKMGNRR